jgi:flagellar motility protein MotE (MotC chaperone)
VYFNVGGVTPQIVIALCGLYADNARAAKVLETRQKALDGAQKKLSDAQAALDKATSAQKKAEEAFRKRQTQLDEDIKAFESKANAEQTASPAAQNSVKDIYASMEAETAAALLAKAPTTQEVADILLQLEPEKAAEILAAMDPKKAYEITRLMVQ